MGMCKRKKVIGYKNERFKDIHDINCDYGSKFKQKENGR